MNHCDFPRSSGEASGDRSIGPNCSRWLFACAQIRSLRPSPGAPPREAIMIQGEENIQKLQDGFMLCSMLLVVMFNIFHLYWSKRRIYVK